MRTFPSISQLQKGAGLVIAFGDGTPADVAPAALFGGCPTRCDNGVSERVDPMAFNVSRFVTISVGCDFCRNAH